MDIIVVSNFLAWTRLEGIYKNIHLPERKLKNRQGSLGRRTDISIPWSPNGVKNTSSKFEFYMIDKAWRLMLIMLNVLVS